MKLKIERGPMFLHTGHMHPPFFKIMNEIQEGLQYVFQTSSKYTLLVSGTGHAGTSLTYYKKLRCILKNQRCRYFESSNGITC